MKVTKNGMYYDRNQYGTVWYGKEPPSRAILTDEKAVSPVIAVILMVAITVVLAATVFVLVNGISQSQNNPGPTIAWQKDGTNLTVTSAPEGLQWGEFEVIGCTKPYANSQLVFAGESLTNCSGKVTVRHVQSNSLSYQGRF